MSAPSNLTGKQFSGSLQNGVATTFSKVRPANYFIRSGGRNVIDHGAAVGSPRKRAPQAYSGQYVEERSREGRRDRPRMARRSRCYWRVSAVTLGRPTCQRRPRRLTARTEGLKMMSALVMCAAMSRDPMSSDFLYQSCQEAFSRTSSLRRFSEFRSQSLWELHLWLSPFSIGSRHGSCLEFQQDLTGRAYP